MDSNTDGQSDHNFDKKLLAAIFLVVMACLMAISLSPVSDQLSQATLVTVLTGALTTLLGGIITLTSGRSAARAADKTQNGGPLEPPKP